MAAFALAALTLTACQEPSASDVQAERLAEVSALATLSLTAAFEFFDTTVSREFTEAITEHSGGVDELGVNPSVEEAAFLLAGKQAIVDGIGRGIALPDLDPSELTHVVLSAYMAWKVGEESTLVTPKNMPQVIALDEPGHYQIVLPAFSFVVGEHMVWHVEFDSENRVRSVDLIEIVEAVSEPTAGE